jgi:cell division protease FtsH
MLDVPGLESGGCPRSPQTQAHIDATVRGIVMDCFERTTALLQRHRAVLERSARELLARETLDETALRELTSGLQGENGTA